MPSRNDEGPLTSGSIHMRSHDARIPVDGWKESYGRAPGQCLCETSETTGAFPDSPCVLRERLSVTVPKGREKIPEDGLPQGHARACRRLVKEAESAEVVVVVVLLEDVIWGDWEE